MNWERSPLVTTLPETVVELVGADGAMGTAFFIAPGLVLTCAHVLGASDCSFRARWGDTELELFAPAEWYRPQLTDGSGPDLALLRVTGELDHPVAVLADAVEPGDELWGFGHPQGAYREGDSVTFRAEGPSARGSTASAPVILYRVTGGRAGPGFSGAPVLNWRTGGVCGVLRFAHSLDRGAPGARLIPIAAITAAYDVLDAPQAVTGYRRAWLRLLDDAQLAQGGWHFPGPVMRAYLAAAASAARDHPHPGVLPGLEPPPLTAVYLRQQAEADQDPDSGQAPGPAMLGLPETETGHPGSPSSLGRGLNQGAGPPDGQPDPEASRTVRSSGPSRSDARSAPLTGRGAPAPAEAGRNRVTASVPSTGWGTGSGLGKRLSVDSEIQEPRAVAGALVPAERILDLAQNVVVIGEPGAGKSSLLRMGLIVAAGRWLDNNGGRTVPVRVTAADLVSAPLPDALAAAVAADINAAGLNASFPSAFFEAPPLPGVAWKVLVDGFDEVLGLAQRRAVIAKLADAARNSSKAVYEFVVATRPLSAPELRRGWQARHYQLQPFTSEQLPELATSWFTALNLAEPQELTRRLLAAVVAGRLTELVRSPLLATMICQLFAADPTRPLPAGRSGAYRQFVELLSTRQYSDAAGGIYPQLTALVGRYGPPATKAAGRVAEQAVELVARLAAVRQGGDTAPAPGLLQEWTADDRPGHVPEAVWGTAVQEIVRRSGLLIERSGDFVFVHQSLGEYLAAQHIAADIEASTAAFNEFFAWRLPSPKSPTMPPRRDPGGHWSPTGTWRRPPWDDSYSSFLIAAWKGRPDLPAALRRLARRGGLHGCRFIATLHQDGIPLGPAVIDEATRTLRRLTTRQQTNTLAAKELARLGDPRGTELLMRLGSRPKQDYWGYRNAARALADLGDPRAAQLHLEVISDHDFDSYKRMQAAEELAHAGDPRGADQLARMATSDHFLHSQQLEAAEHLAMRGDPRGFEQLNRIATDPDIDIYRRYGAAVALINHGGDPRGADLLAGIVADPDVQSRTRANAVDWIARLDHDPHAADLLADIAADTSEATLALQAAVALTGLRDPRGLSLLAAMAADPQSYARSRAAEALADLGDPRGTHALYVEAADPENSDWYTEIAVARLAAYDDPHVADLLTDLASDYTGKAHTRRAARLALARRGDKRGYGAITRWAVSLRFWVASQKPWRG
ncbi:trypsin-like peptidase domain-containing protein (plasmid) [Streptomyces canus]|uniref:trypsin-like peptidase domain-containing protein n=1 Tax=Streptomyces canus TaxID=58343 RepID=UPI002F911B75|nr:trypsin-like peptidase domain-containing protein [Streptomyces canus]